MVVLPAIGAASPSAAVGRLASRARLVRPANGAVLIATAVLVAASPAVAQVPPPGPRGGYDPAAWGDVVAEARLDPLAGPSVQVEPAGGPPVGFAGGRSPSLSADLLAYADPAGIRVVRWTTGEQIARIDGPYDAPALDWPLLAYRVQDPSGAERIDLADLATGERRPVTGALPSADLGRPALRDGLIAWHVATGHVSQVRLRPVNPGPRRSKLIARSRTGLVVNPSIALGRILWVEQRGRISYLRLRRISTARSARWPPCAARASSSGPPPSATPPAYATRWNPLSARARVIRRSWRPRPASQPVR